MQSINQIIKQSQMVTINSIEELFSFCRNINHSIFFVGSLDCQSILTIKPFLAKFEVITFNDPYSGIYPFIKVPEFIKCNQQLQETGIIKGFEGNLDIIQFIKNRDPHCKVLMKNIQPGIEQLYKEKGIEILGISAEMFQSLDNKIKIIDLLKKAQIPYIPNICSKINSYKHLLQIISNFGTTKMVVQSQICSSGRGTMFISNQQDYNKYQNFLQNGEEFKIMAFRHLKCFAIAGMATSSGAIIGPLFSQLIGHQQLTPYLGGYCGSEIRQRYFQDYNVEIKVRQEIFKYTEKFINYVYSLGLLRGTFGVDFSVDMDTNEVFFMEINPRLTGSSNLLYQIYQSQGHKFPIFLYHIAEYLGVKLNLDIKAINNEWLGLKHYKNQFSYAIMRVSTMQESLLPYNIPAAIWTMENGILKLTDKKDDKITDLQEGQIYFTPNRGFYFGTLKLRGLLQDYNFKLTQEAKLLINQLISIRKGLNVS